MNAPPERPQPSKVQRGAVRLMVAIVLAMVLLAIYANVQRHRRDKIESVTITRIPPVSSPAPTR